MNLIHIFDTYNPFRKILSIDYPTDYTLLGIIEPLLVSPTPVVPHYVLNKDLRYRERNDDVRKLQEELIYLGLLKNGLNTSYYGENTRLAVKAFLKKYAVTSSFWIAINNGRWVLTLTRKKLNSIFAA